MEAREMFLEGNLAPGLRAQLVNKWSGLVKDISGKRNAENKGRKSQSANGRRFAH